MRARLSQLVDRLHRDEGGQAIAFGAITLFMLVCFVLMTYNIGLVVSNKIEIQSAADAAAYAGALTEADCISAIAWINEGMAYTYYNAMRYAVDVGVLATLAELKEHGPPPYPSDDVVGIEDPVGQYNDAYLQASEWIPRCEDWLNKLSRIERAIALSAPELIKRDVYRVALTNGGEKAALFPSMGYLGSPYIGQNFPFYPDPGAQVDIECTSFDNGGWRIEEVNERYWLEVTKSEDNDSWEVSTSDGLVFEYIRTGENSWKVKSNEGPDMDIIKVEDTWIIVTGGDRIEYTTTDDGYIIKADGKTIRVRRKPDGGLEQWIGGEWVSMAGDTEVQAGDVTVSVSDTGMIKWGDIWIDLPNVFHIDRTTLTLYDDYIDVMTYFGEVRVRVFGDDVAFSTGPLGTLQVNWDDDGVWRRTDDDRYKHRLNPPVDAPSPGIQLWLYEYRKENSFLLFGSWETFAVDHAIGENYKRESGDMELLPGWAYQSDVNPSGWFNPTSGAPVASDAYFQTRSCWNADDLICPRHGNGGPDEPNGEWHDGLTGARVACPTCRGGRNDNFPIPGLPWNQQPTTSVRKYQRDTFDRYGDLNRMDPLDYQSIDMSKFERPLALSYTLFKYGINVGVWRDKNADLPMIFKNPEWGYLAVASARAGFYDATIDDMRFSFDSAEERDEWVLTSEMNLYEPTWQAKLVSTRDQIMPEDFDLDTDVETGATYLYTGMFRRSLWRSDYNESPSTIDRSLRRTSDGEPVKLEDIGLDEVIEH